MNIDEKTIKAVLLKGERVTSFVNGPKQRFRNRFGTPIRLLAK